MTVTLDPPVCRWRRIPGLAWVGLCLAVALHVCDEAAAGFLDVYDPAVLRIKQQLPFVPLPTFSFETWIVGLAFAVLLGLLLSPHVFRKAGWARATVVVVAILMILNGLGHLTASIVTGTLMPGACSSPILLVTASWALLAASKYWVGQPASDRHA